MLHLGTMAHAVITGHYGAREKRQIRAKCHGSRPDRTYISGMAHSGVDLGNSADALKVNRRNVEAALIDMKGNSRPPPNGRREKSRGRPKQADAVRVRRRRPICVLPHIIWWYFSTEPLA